MPIRVTDPAEGETVAELHTVTPIPKCEGTWWGNGIIWFVSSHGGGPDAEDEEDRSAAAHGGQIWAYDPHRGTLRLVVRFEQSDDFEGPDNITVSPHGYAVIAPTARTPTSSWRGSRPGARRSRWPTTG